MSRPTPAYLLALEDRLNMINDSGTNQTTWQRIQSARDQANKARNDDLALQQKQVDAAKAAARNAAAMPGNVVQGAVHPTTINTGASGRSSNSAFDSFVNRISQQESGGNYGAVNRRSGAMGRYQIMPSNIRGTGRGWDYEVLGRDITTQQFMNSPQLQDQIARAKLQQYYDKYGPAGASIAWYAGPGAANRYAQSGYISKASQNGYPSVQSYVNSATR